MTCLTCKNEIISDWRKDKRYALKNPLFFCSRACSNKRTHSDETCSKISKSVKDTIAKQPINRSYSRLCKDGSLRPLPPPRPKVLSKLKICTFCCKEFTATREDNNKHYFKTTCSDACFIAIKQRNARGNKTIIYNNKRYDSSWEVEMAKFFEEQNILFLHPEAVIWKDKESKIHRYFPDFYIPDLQLYVDPKNPLVVKQQQDKLNIVSTQINLLYGDVKLLKPIIAEKWRAWKDLHPHVSN